MTWAIIPVKRLKEAKSSLKPALSSKQRREFVLHMLEDVLSAVRRAQPIDSVLVVSPDDDVLTLARSKNADPVSEPNIGLNGALEIAIGCANKARIKDVLILPMDVPLLSPVDVERMIGLATSEREIIITPSKDNGTNALFLRPPDILDPNFGGESFLGHIEKAYRSEIVPKIYRSENVEMDIDNPEDLIKLEAKGLGTKSRDFLRLIK